MLKKLLKQLLNTPIKQLFKKKNNSYTTKNISRVNYDGGNFNLLNLNFRLIKKVFYIGLVITIGYIIFTGGIFNVKNTVSNTNNINVNVSEKFMVTSGTISLFNSINPLLIILIIIPIIIFFWRPFKYL